MGFWWDFPPKFCIPQNYIFIEFSQDSFQQLMDKAKVMFVYFYKETQDDARLNDGTFNLGHLFWLVTEKQFAQLGFYRNSYRKRWKGMGERDRNKRRQKYKREISLSTIFLCSEISDSCDIPVSLTQKIGNVGRES